MIGSFLALIAVVATPFGLYAQSGILGRAPEYKLDKKLDLASLFVEALRTEATAMGFKSSSERNGWQLEGTLTAIYLECPDHIRSHRILRLHRHGSAGPK